MQTEWARGAQAKTRAGAPTGFRRLTPSLLRADRAAERFDGLPDGVKAPGQLLAALKAAAPSLGLQMRQIYVLDWLFSFTRPQDWTEGQQPIVWPSALMQQEALGLSKSQVKSNTRGLIEAGLVTMKDSPNGKRYGHRDCQGCIIEAYGFNLSPIAARYPEFVRLAEEAKAKRKMIAALRRRITIARKAIAQSLETALEYGFDGVEWSRLRHDTRNLVSSLRVVERLDEMAMGVASLERRQTESRRRLEQLLETVCTDPKGPENSPHNTTTNQAADSEKNTVLASNGCGSPQGSSRPNPAPRVKQPENEEAPVNAPASEASSGKGGKPNSAVARGNEQPINAHGRTDKAQIDSGPVTRLSIEELRQLAPRLNDFLSSPNPGWPEIVDAAGWLGAHLGISKFLWGRACSTMSRVQAAIAIAIVSAKPDEHFRSTRAAYFHGMVEKAETGRLNLSGTICGLRQQGALSHRTAFQKRGPR